MRGTDSFCKNQKVSTLSRFLLIWKRSFPICFAMSKSKQPRAANSIGPGRPREFDISEALDRAIFVFREKGFNAASISDLSQATNLTSGSIYKAFKDKKGVFLAALERYVASRNAALAIKLSERVSGREQLRAFIELYADSSQGVEGRMGCMVISALTEISTLDPDMVFQVKAAYARLEDKLTGLLLAGQADGSISRSVDPQRTARVLLFTLQGMRLAGKVGHVSKHTNKLVDDVMHLIG